MKLSVLVVFFVALLHAQQDEITIRRYSGQASEMAESWGKEERARFARMYRQVMDANNITPLLEKHALVRVRALGENMDDESRQEMQSFAESVGVDYKQVLLVNCFYELDTSQCRQAVIWDKKSADKSLIHARNLDWPDWDNALRDNNVLLVRRYAQGNEIATLTWPGIFGALTGCNDKGLAVAFNQLYGAQSLSGEPMFLILKRVLRRADTLDEAIAVMKESEICTSGSIVISSASERRAILVETSNGKMSVKEPAEDFAVNANTAYFDRDGTFDEEQYRRCPLYSIVDKAEAIDVAALQKTMADPQVLLSVNILTVLFCLESDTIYLSCGRYRAATGPYRKIHPLFGTHKNKEENR